MSSSALAATAHFPLPVSPVNSRVLKSTHLDSNPGSSCASSVAWMNDFAPLNLSFLPVNLWVEFFSMYLIQKVVRVHWDNARKALEHYLAHRSKHHAINISFGWKSPAKCELERLAKGRAGVLWPVHHWSPGGWRWWAPGVVGWLFVWLVQMTYYTSLWQGSRKEEDKKSEHRFFQHMKPAMLFPDPSFLKLN